MTISSPHILVAHDEPSTREFLATYLGGNGMKVSMAASGEEMGQTLRESAISLVLLDNRLGDEDGLQLARALCNSSATPVIFLTSKGEEADRVMGLEIAADDYVTQPFSSRELLARIRAVLRRYNLIADREPRSTHDRRAYQFDGWELNRLTRRLVAPEGRRVDLSNGEFNLLLAMCKSPGRVLTRDQLLDLSRLHGAEVYDRTIDVQVLRLRRKIETDPATPRFIVTQRGAGYVFNAQVQALA